jgi:hypothetical protein
LAVVSIAGALTAFAETGSVEDTTGAIPHEALRQDRVVLYYFHRTIRCETCLKFEVYSNDVVREAFATQMAEGVLEWLVVNIDAEDSQPLVERYELEGSSLVSTVLVHGEETGWRPLDAIWWLVDDEAAFKDYVQSEVLSDLEALGKQDGGADADSLPLYRQLVPESDGGGVDAPPQG